MKRHSDLQRQLEQLEEHESPQQRGYEFEAFVAALFRREHFEVVPDPGTAAPRQTDLLAKRVNDVYLVEVKWRSDSANIDDVDSLFSRLRDSPPAVGVMVSFNGFTEGAVNRVEQWARQPILLVTGKEIKAAIERYDGLSRLLQRKRNMLLDHRIILLDAEPDTRLPVRPDALKELVSAPKHFEDIHGDTHSSLRCQGRFGQFTFALRLPDIDWIPGGGFGVATDAALSLSDESEVLALVSMLSEMGWATEGAHWSIQQATTNWHGFGPLSFAEALADWENRHQGLETHHAEEFCYFDACDGGFYTFTATIAAHKPRQVHYASLSFQLIGIPLNTDSLRHLHDVFGVSDFVAFRPRSTSSVERTRLDRAAQTVEPVGFIVDSDSRYGTTEEPRWAVGVVARNPYFQHSAQDATSSTPTWMPRNVLDSEYLICDLRSHHTADLPKRTYYLWGVESSHTADASIHRFIADW